MPASAISAMPPTNNTPKKPSTEYIVYSSSRHLHGGQECKTHSNGRDERGLRVLDYIYASRSFPGWAAEPFLLHPTSHIRGTIFDGDVSRFGGAKKHHRVAIHEGHVCEVQGYCFRCGRIPTQKLLDLRKVLF